MPFNDEQHDRIVSALIARRANKDCEVCGHSEFTIVEDPVPLPVRAGAIGIVPKVIPSVAAYCQNCGNIHFHALKVLGLDDLGRVS